MRNNIEGSTVMQHAQFRLPTRLRPRRRRMAMLISRAHLLTLLLMGMLCLVASARADDFYKGKLFTIVFGFSPVPPV